MSHRIDTTTLAKLATDAMLVQDACNLSGVVISWARAVQELRTALTPRVEGGLFGPGPNTDDINHHPINVLWAFKCADLAGLNVILACDGYSEAYEQCRTLADATRQLSTGKPEDYEQARDKLVHAAAVATDHFTEDELEEHAAAQAQLSAGKYEGQPVTFHDPV